MSESKKIYRFIFAGAKLEVRKDIFNVVRETDKCLYIRKDDPMFAYEQRLLKSQLEKGDDYDFFSEIDDPIPFLENQYERYERKKTEAEKQANRYLEFMNSIKQLMEKEQGNDT